MTSPELPAAITALAVRSPLAAAALDGTLVRGLAPASHVCHADDCDQPATHQTQRNATADEATAHWDALERNIIESGNPDYVQDRSGPVNIARFHCDHPDHADPLYLEAKSREETAPAPTTLAANAAPGDDRVSLCEQLPIPSWVTLTAGTQYTEQVLVFRVTGDGPYVAELGLSEKQRVKLRKPHAAGAYVRVDLVLPTDDADA